MGLFFHQSESQYTQFGVESWSSESSQPRVAAITGRFFESVKCKNKEEITFWVNDQEIYCQKDGTIRTLKLCLTVMEEQLCLKHHRKAFAIKLMRDEKLTILFTYDEDLFISFYSYLSKYCILKNFRKHFKLSSKLGEGSFSTVYTGTNIFSGSQVALKVINKSDILKLQEGVQLVINEIENLQKLRKYGLSPLIQVYETQDCIILVMQKACAGNMRQYLLNQQKNYSLSMIRQIMKKVLESLKGLHAAGFIHRDIKPQNIFFMANSAHSALILGDFGLSIDKNHFSHNKLAKLCSGTLGFIAPQVIHQNQYDEKCDLFSVGCLYYFLCTGTSIFSNKSADQIYEMTDNSYVIEQKIKKVKGIDQVGRDLMKKLLVIDPKKRISAQQALKHQYFLDQAPYIPCAGEDDDTIKDYIKQRIRKYWS